MWHLNWDLLGYSLYKVAASQKLANNVAGKQPYEILSGRQ